MITCLRRFHHTSFQIVLEVFPLSSSCCCQKTPLCECRVHIMSLGEIFSHFQVSYFRMGLVIVFFFHSVQLLSLEIAVPPQESPCIFFLSGAHLCLATLSFSIDGGSHSKGIAFETCCLQLTLGPPSFSLHTLLPLS